MSSWHARAAILAYLQVTVFCNLFILQQLDIIDNIRQLVLKLLCDDQLEVNVTPISNFFLAHLYPNTRLFVSDKVSTALFLGLFHKIPRLVLYLAIILFA